MQKNGTCGLRRGGRRENPCEGISLRDSLSRVADPDSLDATVDEVFRTMLGVKCRRVLDKVSKRGESVTAVVGFGGLLSGACVVRCGAKDAMEIAARLTGAALRDVDDTVKDAIGEIGNMLAGAWKSRIPELATHCGLSLPAVITGHSYELRVQAPEFELRHEYSFDQVEFQVTIVCDGLQ